MSLGDSEQRGAPSRAKCCRRCSQCPSLMSEVWGYNLPVRLWLLILSTTANVTHIRCKLNAAQIKQPLLQTASEHWGPWDPLKGSAQVNKINL